MTTHNIGFREVRKHQYFCIQKTAKKKKKKKKNKKKNALSGTMVKYCISGNIVLKLNESDRVTLEDRNADMSCCRTLPLTFLYNE